jgi:hypothetical protein
MLAVMILSFGYLILRLVLAVGHPRGPRANAFEYLAHYNGRRPHQDAGNARPTGTRFPHRSLTVPWVRVRRRQVLHGLVNEYEQAA